MPNNGSLYYVFITLWPSTIRYDYVDDKLASQLLRKYHISRGSTHILRHWSHPLRHIWTIIAYMDILYTFHVGYYRVTSFFYHF
jgi:hypothetical protein